MPVVPEIDLQRREKLESAWEIFADLIFPGMNYREELASLRRGRKDETLKESEERQKRLERRTSGLKQQFLSFIPDGFFHIFGLNPDTDLNSPDLRLLNCKLFSPKQDGFEVNWEGNQIKVAGRTFIALEFQPNIDVIRAAWPSTGFSKLINRKDDAEEAQLSDLDLQQKEQATSVPTQASAHRKPSGAKAQTEFRNHVVAECYRRHSDFDEWPFGSKQSECIRLAKEMRPTQDWSARFFGRTSIYDAIKALKAAGRIPSGNVQ